jgi:uncharacterized protein involved in exopolysaccharide biosynthesis
MAFAVFLTVLGASLSAYLLVGRRYDAEALLLVGNRVTERSESRSVVDPTGINSLARIAVTDDVVREAANKVGLQRLFPDLDQKKRNGGTLISILRGAAAKLGLERLIPADQTRRDDGILISMLRRSMSVQAEGKTDLLKISFPHRDPVIAAEFVNALAVALVAKEAELLNVPGAFLDAQRKQAEEEVQEAASKLESFSAAVSIYSINDQRSLLLKRANDLAVSLSSTRGSIVDLHGQKETLNAQLLRARERIPSAPINAVESTGSGARTNQAERSLTDAPRSLTDAPPLVLTHVYENVMAALFKVNADFAGAKNREAQLGAELQSVNNELAALSSREAEYNRLSRDLTVAAAAAEGYAKRTTEERINTSLANARLSGLRIAQLANPPHSPAFPQLIIFLALGLVGGIILASAAALLPEALARVGTHDAVSPEYADSRDRRVAAHQNRAKPHVI